MPLVVSVSLNFLPVSFSRCLAYSVTAFTVFIFISGSPPKKSISQCLRGPLAAIKKSIDWSDYYSTITYTIPAIKNEIAVRGLDSNISASGEVDYDYDSWETDWDLYGVSELEIKRDNYDEQLETLKASGFDKTWDQVKDDDSNSFTEDYFIKMHEMYLKYKSERADCSNALTKRKKELDTANSTLESYNNTRKSICDDVSKDNVKYGFDQSDLSILWKLYNEVDYVNNNFFVSRSYYIN